MIDCFVSIIIPTLNSQSVLEKCLKSISAQKYPKSKIEIIISDGGSTDDTLKIARRFKAQIINNKLITAEAGKAIGTKKAIGELIAFIDSDNILPNNHWLSDMVKPFEDDDIIISEPIKYSYRKSDPFLTRYFALLGMNDPICLFIGNYDRYSYITKKWTNLQFPVENKKTFVGVVLNKLPVPTIGANGTFFRKKYLSEAIKNVNYLFDVDIIYKLIKNLGEIKIAKVKTGIVHTFVESDINKFFRKQLRRINDMSFHRSKNNREINWEKNFLLGIIKFILSCLFVLPIIYQTAAGYYRKPDKAWFFHPLACYSTLFIYIYGWVRGKIAPSESNRQNWKQ